MVDQLIEKVRTFSEEHALLPKGSPLIVGLSGGPDSIALVSLLKALEPEYGYKLVVAHLDHQWRPNSAQDVIFCKEFAEGHNIAFEYTAADQITLLKKTHSQEDTGRLLRRTYFEQLAQKYNAAAIVLGHHYQDQQETFFLRMIRGASIAGLAGMKPKHDGYIRPLLSCSKDELIAYLKEKNIPFLIDETNEDQKYLRNALRHTVIPALRGCDTRFDKSFLKALVSLQETDAYLERIAKETLRGLTQASDELAIAEFLETDEFLHPRILVQWLCEKGVPFTPTTKFFDELVRFIRNNAQEHQLHSSWKLCKSGNKLSIEKKRPLFRS
jgi:tRNA(Ile)-lysidine synthase